MDRLNRSVPAIDKLSAIVSIHPSYTSCTLSSIRSLQLAQKQSTMTTTNLGREVIALAGAGDLGRYVCEEILKSPDFVPIILSRGVGTSTPHPGRSTYIGSQPSVDLFDVSETDRYIM